MEFCYSMSLSYILNISIPFKGDMERLDNGFLGNGHVTTAHELRLLQYVMVSQTWVLISGDGD